MLAIRAGYFAICVVGLLALPVGAQERVSGQKRQHTAREIVDLIKQHVGVPWREQTVDTIKAGDPETPVTGIATTMMATFDVLRRASAAGANLVITHEPVFYTHLDSTE